MADMKIEEATRVTSVVGSEILPASVSGAAKSLTTEQVKAYIISAIAALADVSDFGTDASDRVMVKTNGENKHIAFSAFADDVFSALMGKTAATTLADADTLIIKNESDEKTVTVGALKTYISNAFSGNMDILGLTAADSASSTDELAVYQAGETNANRKVTVAQLATAVAPTVATAATESTSAIANTDAIIIARAPSTTGGTPTLQKVPLQDAGLFVSNVVTGPSSDTTENKIPQWDQTSRILKNGLSLTKTSTSEGTTSSNIGSTSTDSEVPSSKAVYHHVQEQRSSLVSKTSGTTTEGNIPRWDSTSGQLTNGLSFVVGTTGDSGIDANSTNAQIPSAKAVYEYGREKLIQQVTCSETTTADKIPQWENSTKELKNGLDLKTSVRAANEASNNAIATERAVRTSMAGRPTRTTENNIPQWDVDDGMLKDGLSVSTSISGSSTNSQVPTALAVYNYSIRVIKRIDTGIRGLGELPDGIPFGSFLTSLYYPLDGIMREGLFMNFGSASNKDWRYLCDLADTLPAT